jgi:hypothetical protein
MRASRVALGLVLVCSASCSGDQSDSSSSVPASTVPASTATVSTLAIPREASDGSCAGGPLATAELIRIDGATGDVVWSTEVPEVDSITPRREPLPNPSLLVNDGVAIVATSPRAAGGYLVGIDAASGDPMWQVSAPGVRGPIAIGDTVVITERPTEAGPSDQLSSLVGLSVHDGSEQWRTEFAARSEVEPGADGFYAASDDQIVAFAADGSERWSQDAPALPPDTLMAGDGLLLVDDRTEPGGLRAYETSTGDLVWESSLRYVSARWPISEVGHGALAAFVLFPDRDRPVSDPGAGPSRSLVQVIDALTGEALWDADVHDDQSAWLFDDDLLLVAGDDGSTAYREGNEVWSMDGAASQAVTGPGGTIVTVLPGPTTDGAPQPSSSILAVIDRATGEMLSQAQLPGGEVGRPVLEDGVAYVVVTPTRSGNEVGGAVDAVDLDDGTIIWDAPLAVAEAHAPVVTAGGVLLLTRGAQPECPPELLPEGIE